MDTSLLWNRLHSLGKVCLHCAYIRTTQSLFCHECEITLWRRHQANLNFQISDMGLTCETLFSWYPDQDRQISRLLSQLKGGKQKAAFDFYAQRFLARLEKPVSAGGDTCLVPCPSRSGRPDHSMAFAQSLSKYMGIPIQNLLALSGDGMSQKAKTKQERLNREVHLLSPLKAKNVIFIDDVVTTGATASSAHRALNVPGDFRVWTLAWRRDLAGLDLL